MFLQVETTAVRVNEAEVLVRLCAAAVESALDRLGIRVLVLGKNVGKVFRRLKRGSIRGGCRTAVGAERALKGFKVDACLISHGHLRTSVISPGKIENNLLADSGNEKRRSPVPLPADGSANAAQLSPDSSSQQTAQWLRKNSFGNYVTTFANFTGADILRLTRDDLIQICGLPDGIRLLYALHSKAIVRLTLYICTSSSGVYHAVYLDHMGRTEMSRKLAKLLGIQQTQIQDIFLQGPNDIKVLVTDEVISNIKDESMFTIEVLKDEGRGKLVLMLKPTGPAT